MATPTSKPWKSRSIIRLAIYLNPNSPTDSFEEAEKKRRAKAMRNIKELSAVASGTPIVIMGKNGEEVVHFIGVTPPYAVCEYSDGRHHCVLADLFVRMHDGPPPHRVSEVERGRREIIRDLGTENDEMANDTIVAQGSGWLDMLLSELSSALKRIKGALVVKTDGFVDVRYVRDVSQEDEALAKRIPEVLAEIARTTDEAKVRAMIAACKSAGVKRLCLKALDKAIDATAHSGKTPQAAALA